MKAKLSHIAWACPEIAKALEKLGVLGLGENAERHHVPTEKVTAAMVRTEFSEHFRIELLEPTEAISPIGKFLTKRPEGGIHHICFEVENLEAWKTKVEQAGFEIIAPGIRTAVRGKAFFIHPKSIGGVLVELEEIKK